MADDPVPAESDDLLIEMGELAVLHLQPGDVVVLSCDDVLSQGRKAFLRAFWEQEFPGHTVKVLDGGLRLGAFRRG